MKTCSLVAAIAAAAALAACQNLTPAVPGGTPAPGTPTTVTASAAPVGLQPTMQATKVIPVGKSPHGIAGAGDFVYNSNTGDGTISVIDAKTDAVVKTIPVPDGKPGYAHGYRGKFMLVLETAKGQLLVFDPAQDHKLLQAVDLGLKPDKIRFTAEQGGRLRSGAQRFLGSAARGR